MSIMSRLKEPPYDDKARPPRLVSARRNDPAPLELESAIGEMVKDVSNVAHPRAQHPQTLVRATTNITCEAILKVCEETSKEISVRIEDVEKRVAELRQIESQFRDALAIAATALVEQIEQVMSEHESIVGFMRDRLTYFERRGTAETTPAVQVQSAAAPLAREQEPTAQPAPVVSETVTAN